MAFEWLKPVVGAAVGGPIGFAAGAGMAANDQQAGAAKDAQAQNAALIQQQMANQQGAAYTANNLIYGALPGAQDYMGQGYQGAADFATQGLGQQRGDIMQGGQLAAGAIGQGQGQSLAQMYAGAGQGIDYTNSGLQSGVGAIGDRSNRSGAMLDQPGGMYGNYQADPGYQMRLQQGESAIRNMQAAQGGRFGGAAAKALVDYNQNMASQEFGNYANRQNQIYGANSAADAQSLSAQSNLASQYANAGSQAAGMAYGAGQGGAGIYGQGAQSLADIYARTGTQLGSQASSAGTALGGMTQDYYGQLANSDYGLAGQMGQNMMNGANAGQQLVGSAVANNNSTIPYAGANWATAANGVNQATQLAATAWLAGGFGGGGGARPPQMGSPYPGGTGRL